MQIKRILILISALLACCGVHTQNKIDSLKRVAQSPAVDTAVIDAQVELASIYRKKNIADTARLYVDKAFAAAQRIHYKRGEGRALYQQGVLLAGEGKYVDAMRSFDNAAVLADSANDKKTQASALQGIGNQKAFLGDYTGALEYCVKSIEIKRELGDSTTLSTAYGSLGNLYNLSGQHNSALETYRAALHLDSVLGNIQLLPTDYYNVANTYHLMQNDSMALVYIERSIAAADQVGDDGTTAYALGMKGIILHDRKQFGEALQMGMNALAIAEKYQEHRLMASQYVNVGISYRSLGNYKIAELYLDSSLQLSVAQGMKDRIYMAYYELSLLYEEMGETAKALASFKRYIQVKDSLSRDSQKDDMLRLELNYKFEKQKELDKAEQDKSNAIYEEDKKRKSLIIYAGAGFLVLVLIFLAFVFNRYRISQRQKALIAEQKTEVEKQKSEIEEKNKDITDSINYAQRIQAAILPDLNEFREALPDSFVFYRPKDIVSGDFYWVTQTPEYVFYATADCTGHGVPGGFMSVLGASLLNEIVNEKGLTDPAQVMNVMRDRIIGALKQKGISGENKDGMDMVLCRINRDRTELCFAAAHNDLWLFRNREWITFKADKQPVGIGATESVSFTKHVVALQQGDLIYTFTDGFADQFGGPKGKKFKYAALQQLMTEVSGHSMSTQSEKIGAAFAEWKGSLEQVDDVLVIGVRV